MRSGDEIKVEHEGDDEEEEVVRHEEGLISGFEGDKARAEGEEAFMQEQGGPRREGDVGHRVAGEEIMKDEMVGTKRLEADIDRQGRAKIGEDVGHWDERGGGEEVMPHVEGLDIEGESEEHPREGANVKGDKVGAEGEEAIMHEQGEPRREGDVGHRVVGEEIMKDETIGIERPVANINRQGRAKIGEDVEHQDERVGGSEVVSDREIRFVGEAQGEGERDEDVWQGEGGVGGSEAMRDGETRSKGKETDVSLGHGDRVTKGVGLEEALVDRVETNPATLYTQLRELKEYLLTHISHCQAVPFSNIRNMHHCKRA